MFNTGTKCVFTFYVLHGLSTSIYICRGLLQASAVPSPLGPTQHDIIDGSLVFTNGNFMCYFDYPIALIYRLAPSTKTGDW